MVGKTVGLDRDDMAQPVVDMEVTCPKYWGFEQVDKRRTVVARQPIIMVV